MEYGRPTWGCVPVFFFTKLKQLRYYDLLHLHSVFQLLLYYSVDSNCLVTSDSISVFSTCKVYLLYSTLPIEASQL